ncbi:Spherulation-specific family 4-domain-containing protein [Neurospora tetraspora]|uniref:Spherulation-specific family 4-domain-containing protein n=1 Tax=Neurospora tetraspora TaxID=94610 RepID=A0AAE0MQX7_9PEZI|nr:Spherulation-specific family 4-domain-containing protein [Neurospora tetraspora]
MSTILVPLYIYPSSWSESLGSGWSPLFSALTTALTKNPSLEFLVVINPGNGPGPDYPIPNADYRAALSALSDSDRFPNVKVIGYVHCSYGQRDVEEVRKDVEGYLGWLEFAERGEWQSPAVTATTSFTSNHGALQPIPRGASNPALPAQSSPAPGKGNLTAPAEPPITDNNSS